MRKKTIAIMLIIFIIGMIGIVAKDMIVNKNKFVNNEPAHNQQAEKAIKRKIAIINGGVNLNKVTYNKNLNIITHNMLDNSKEIKDLTNNLGTNEFAALYNSFNGLGLTNDIMLIKAFDKESDLKNNDIVKALTYARDNNAQIINLPFAFVANSAINEEINNCISKGIIVVVSPKATLANDTKAIFVTNKKEDHENEIIINNKNQLVCLKKVCTSNNDISLSSTYITGFLANKFDYQQFFNKTLTPEYTIQ